MTISSPVLDDFNRSNEGPPPGSNWTTWNGQLATVSNQCKGLGATGNNAYWTTPTYQDAEAYFTIVAIPTTNNFFVLAWVRLADLASNGDAYGGGYRYKSAVADTKILVRIDNGSPTAIASTNEDVATTEKYAVQAIGSTIKMFEDVGSGWAEKLSTTDSTYTAAGYLAMSVDGTVGINDDFGGGAAGGKPYYAYAQQ